MIVCGLIYRVMGLFQSMTKDFKNAQVVSS